MILTTAAITALLTTLATKGLEKAVETTGEKISENSISWIKSLFYKEDKPKRALIELQNNPNDNEKLMVAKGIIDNAIEDNPELEKYLEEIISKTQTVNNSISDSKNVNTGNINTAGGDLQIGDRYGN